MPCFGETGTATYGQLGKIKAAAKALESIQTDKAQEGQPGTATVHANNGKN